MNKIGLFGGGFQHAYSSTLWKHPSFFKWEKNSSCEYNCFIDEAIVANINTPIKKFAWLVENSETIEKYTGTISKVIENAEEISKAYDFVLSHDKRLYSLAPNFYYLPSIGTWIETPRIYKKNKLCSMTCSNQRQLTGHDFRLQWAKKLINKVDLYGRWINPFNKKEDALCDYMFSVTIESAQYETYFTEKLLDCFATGTIPIYHGAPDISKHFNMDGIILLTENFDPSQLSPELYLSKENAILDNLNRVLKYNTIEDWIWERFIKKHENI
jgi:hypothetical protein